jgi:hypothetical protein
MSGSSLYLGHTLGRAMRRAAEVGNVATLKVVWKALVNFYLDDNS